jgi:chaperonin cofactor prefoldin
MSDQIKLPEDLLMEIQKLKDELTQNVVRIGRINVEIAFHKKDIEYLDKELSGLYDQAESIQIRETELQNRIIAEYGNGKLDFETGVFSKES